jgi:hypothetical protein
MPSTNAFTGVVVMEEREAFQLLTLASARDGRTVSQATARVWASDLERVSLEDAVAAAQLHYRESTDWLMPAHVIRNAKRAAETRLPPRMLEADAGECTDHTGYPLPCIRCQEGES